ncbi:MAG: hypothetical protein R2695_05520 [Acidimicrobiales bacterium]
MTDTPEWTAFAETFAERLADRAGVAEGDRRLSAETIAEAEPLWPLVVPTSLGGHGADLSQLLQITRILARGCPASAWTLAFLVMHSWLIAKFPAPGRAEAITARKPWALAPRRCPRPGR